MILESTFFMTFCNTKSDDSKSSASVPSSKTFKSNGYYKQKGVVHVVKFKCL